MKQLIVFKTDNKEEMFLSSIRMISEDWINDAKTSALITGINDILKDIQIENIILIVIIFDNITVFTVFLSLGEKETSSKTFTF